MKQNIRTQVKETKVESPIKRNTMKTTKKSSVWTLEELMEMGHRYDGDGTEWIVEKDEDGKLYNRQIGSGIKYLIDK